jgi:hypothetical protein
LSIHAVATLAGISLAQARECDGMSESRIRQAIVQESRMAYYRLGHSCACPYDLARNGQECGRLSAYGRPGGATPKCYVADITVADSRAYCRSLDQN